MICWSRTASILNGPHPLVGPTNYSVTLDVLRIIRIAVRKMITLTATQHLHLVGHDFGAEPIRAGFGVVSLRWAG